MEGEVGANDGGAQLGIVSVGNCCADVVVVSVAVVERVEGEVDCRPGVQAE